MKIRYLTYNEILQIYRFQIEKYGGAYGITDNNILLSVVANPQRQFGKRELYKGITSKVAIFVYTMIKNHPFLDGNKRTAFVGGRVFLRINGYDVKSIKDYYNLISKIGKNEFSMREVFNWFEKFVIPKKV